MMIFSEDTEIARSIPDKIVSYSTSFLDVGKSNRIACYSLPGWGFKLQANTDSHLPRSVIHIKDQPVGINRVRVLLRDFC